MEKAVRTTAQALAQQKADAERARQAEMEAGDALRIAPASHGYYAVMNGDDLVGSFQSRTEAERLLEAERVLLSEKLKHDAAPKPQHSVPPPPPVQKSGAVVPAKATAAAVPDARTPQQAYLDEIAPPSLLVGRPIKFDTKAGQWRFADTDDAINPDVDFIALCDETLIGWVRFWGKGAQPDRVQGLLYDGFVMPPQDTLPDRDQSEWELGLSGEPADPWQHQVVLPLQSPGTHEMATFATTTRTGRRAVGNLLRHYDRMARRDNDHYPVVRLKVSGFTHRDERIGWVHTPVFAVVGKAPRASAALPDTSPSGDLDDGIPF